MVWSISLATLRTEGLSEGHRRFLTVLLAVNAISLAFDIRDGWRWWKGEREIA